MDKPMKVKFPTLTIIITALMVAIEKAGVPEALKKRIAHQMSGLHVLPLQDAELPSELQPIAERFRQIPELLEAKSQLFHEHFDGINLELDHISIPYHGPVARLILDVSEHKGAIVFWKPRLVRDIVVKHHQYADEVTFEQRKLLDLRREFNLPYGFLDQFGSARLLASLVEEEEEARNDLFYFRQLPIEVSNRLESWPGRVLTDSFLDGHRLTVHHYVHGVGRQSIAFDRTVGVFPIGTVEIED